MSDLPRIEYAPENLYCVASSLADLIERMIADLSHYAGYPCGMTADEYQKVLRRIQKGFAAVDPLMNDHTLTDKQRAKLGKQFDRGMELLKEHYFTLWF